MANAGFGDSGFWTSWILDADQKPLFQKLKKPDRVDLKVIKKNNRGLDSMALEREKISVLSKTISKAIEKG